MASPARATFLAPGATVTPDSNPLASTDVLLATTGVQTFSFKSGTGTDTGTFVENIYRSVAGTLDITMQLTNSASSISSLEVISPADFAPFGPASAVTTDVSATGPGVAPASAFRGALDGGHVINFNFTGSAAAEIAPGQQSQLLIIRTSGTAFTTGSAGISDGGATTVNGFSPYSVPEPTSVVLMGLGLVGTLGACRVRGSRKPA